MQRPNLSRLLVAFARQAVPQFNFTSIQVNRDLESALHVDANNMGPSYIVGLGNYKGGDLWVHREGKIDLRGQWVSIDGNIPHGTMPFTGRRYTLVYFTQKSYRLMQHEDRQLLIQR